MAPLEPEAALLQLSSAILPVGAFSYSQGLETAIADGALRSAGDVEVHIRDLLTLVVARYEAPLWWRLRSALDRTDHADFHRWNDDFLATRESAELRAETLQMGHSMIELLRGLSSSVDGSVDAAASSSDAARDAGSEPTAAVGICADIDAAAIDAWTWPAAHALASRRWRIPPRSALNGYLFGWLENQVVAGMKSLPYGQLAGQRMLVALRGSLVDVVHAASSFDDGDLTTQAPGYAIASARHESQYSRLFRS